MSSYGQYCPMAKAMEILGERWTMLVLRDLLTGVRHFNELARGLPRMSRSLLSQRLKRLQEAGIVARRCEPGGAVAYLPTEAGAALWPVLDSLMTWGARWAFDEPQQQDLDPVLLMWWLRRHVATENLPHRRVTVEFRFTDDEHGRYWLVLDVSDVSVCFDPPPFEVDVWVECTMTTFYRVWLGRTDYQQALAQRQLDVRGDPSLERAFPSWFAWSPAAPWVRAAARP